MQARRSPFNAYPRSSNRPARALSTFVDVIPPFTALSHYSTSHHHISLTPSKNNKRLLAFLMTFFFRSRHALGNGPNRSLNHSPTRLQAPTLPSPSISFLILFSYRLPASSADMDSKVSAISQIRYLSLAGLLVIGSYRYSQSPALP